MSGVRWLRLHWDRVGAWACTLVGAVALILGWIGVSATGLAAAQMPYIISGGIGGIFLLGLGAMLWLSADLRDEWVKLDRVEQKVDEVAATLRHGQADDPSPRPTPSPPVEVAAEAPAQNGRVRPRAFALPLAATTAPDEPAQRAGGAVSKKAATAPRARARAERESTA